MTQNRSSYNTGDQMAFTAFETTFVWPSVAPARDARFMGDLANFVNTVTGSKEYENSLGMIWIMENVKLFEALTKGQDRTAFFYGLLGNPHITALLYMPEVLDMLPANQATKLVRAILETHEPRDLGWLSKLRASHVNTDWLGEYVVGCLYRCKPTSEVELAIVWGNKPMAVPRMPWPRYVTPVVDPSDTAWGLLTDEQLVRVAEYLVLGGSALLQRSSGRTFHEELQARLGAAKLEDLVSAANFRHNYGLTQTIYESLSTDAQQEVLDKCPALAARQGLTTQLKNAVKTGNYPLAELLLQAVLNCTPGNFTGIRQTTVMIAKLLEGLRPRRMASDLAYATIRALRQLDSVEVARLESVSYTDRYGNQVENVFGVRSLHKNWLLFVDKGSRSWEAKKGTMVLFDSSEANLRVESSNERQTVFNANFVLVPLPLVRLLT